MMGFRTLEAVQTEDGRYRVVAVGSLEILEDEPVFDTLVEAESYILSRAMDGEGSLHPLLPGGGESVA